MFKEIRENLGIKKYVYLKEILQNIPLKSIYFYILLGRWPKAMCTSEV